jgi:hypothetical protein
MTPTLGFSIACYKGDIPPIQEGLASIRYFTPNAPISLLAGGDFSAKTLEREYDPQII